MTQDLTSLICLFHHADQAHAALEDILKAGIPESNVTLIGGAGSAISASRSSLAELNVPEKVRSHFLEALEDGGVVVSVAALSNLADQVESIFENHKAGKIDEEVVDDDMSAAALPLASNDGGERTIPIVEEDLLVGKREVDAGGVRVYRRIVEIPVEERVTLREEHVAIERHPVDRPATDADLALQGNRTIELTETAEEAVVSKSAHVVEEVLVGKLTSQHTEHIADTVRRTEVEVEELAPAERSGRPL